MKRNWITTAGVKSLAEGLRLQRRAGDQPVAVVVLDLSGNRLDKEAAEVLADAAHQELMMQRKAALNFEVPWGLEKLYLKNCQIDGDLLKVADAMLQRSLQVDALKEERVENHSAKIRKRFDECSFRCGNLLASVLTSNGRWQQAETILREVWLVAQLTLHESNQDVPQSISNVAKVLERQGNWQEAEKMCRKNLQICRGCFEKDHDYTLISKNELASLFNQQGKWQEAEEMHREVLEARRRVLGERDPDTLSSKNNLASLFNQQGKWQEAEEMQREVLEAGCQVLGERHPGILNSKNNLANVLRKQGKWQEAEEMYREVLQAGCQVLGESHPDTLSSKSNFADVFRKQGKWQEAEEMQREVLEVRRRAAEALSKSEALREQIQERRLRQPHSFEVFGLFEESQNDPRQFFEPMRRDGELKLKELWPELVPLPRTSKPSAAVAEVADVASASTVPVSTEVSTASASNALAKETGMEIGAANTSSRLRCFNLYRSCSRGSLTCA
eukprot:symbB.v1.2.024270.t2/scaffold2285.1/size83374/2